MKKTASEEKVVLVNENNQVLGTMEKLEAHEKGLLHRAFSVLLYNETGEMLIQRRALGKYHTPGLWTNACCSHPREGETITAAASRRLREELGIVIPSEALQVKGAFVYKAAFDNGLTEHEYDTMVAGHFDGIFEAINPDEVEAVRWIDMETLKLEVKENPEKFTPWFKEIIKRV